MAKRIRKRGLKIEFLQLISGIGLEKGKKAAPRFELGIKDLQSSALPLGHAADRVYESPSADRISQVVRSLLVLCNGHGEDLIAMRILEALHHGFPEIELEVLPLVGEGKAFQHAVSLGWLKQLGPLNVLPSGGFSNQSFSALIADIFSGLLGKTLKQWSVAIRAASKGQAILAVGDLLPLVMAWGSGGQYGFIGTPKSDYTWRSGLGKSFSDYYHALKGTEWDPWEWFLMNRPRCSFVAVRDGLTARGLRKHRVKAFALGNPMMDGFVTGPPPESLNAFRRLLLLCGSRMPEAGENFKRLINALADFEAPEPLAVLVPVGAQPSLEVLEVILKTKGFLPSNKIPEGIPVEASWFKGPLLILIGSGKFMEWAPWAELGIATAGTATEQLVGLGIPALSLPGPGPQFNQGFAERQSRLLGGAVITCSSSIVLLKRLQSLLRNEQLRNELGRIGMKRMGDAGGSVALAGLASLLCDKI